jgi:hypothetical protein
MPGPGVIPSAAEGEGSGIRIKGMIAFPRPVRGLAASAAE